jgi:hypothetical protein
LRGSVDYHGIDRDEVVPHRNLRLCEVG